MPGVIRTILSVSLVAMLAVVGYRAIAGGRTSETPGVYTRLATLDSAIAESQRTGKPVVAIAGATWCGPCKRMKRTTLADESVQAWLDDRTVPIYVDVDANVDDARRLGIVSIPTTTLIVDGDIAGQIKGVVSPNELTGWIEGLNPAAN